MHTNSYGLFPRYTCGVGSSDVRKLLPVANCHMNYLIPELNISKHTNTLGGQVTCVCCSDCSLIGLTCCPHSVGGAENRKRTVDASCLHAVAGARHFGERGPSSASPATCDKVSKVHLLLFNGRYVVHEANTASLPDPKMIPGSIFC